MIRVWTDNRIAGVLDRFESRGSTFVYDAAAEEHRAVSMTMPVRTASWNTSQGLAPIFEMNLPEGALRERLRLAFAKATGTFDDLDLLTVVGRSQIGRMRYAGAGKDPDEEVPFQSIDEILENRRGGELYRYLIERFASYSGISGVQPKFLVRDEDSFSAAGEAKQRLSSTFRGATHLVKFWDAAEFPQLAANEFFCLKAAQKAGLAVPPHRLAEDGSALVMERFDLRPDGAYLGFEDFCVLNARRTDEKYRGSYETSVLRRFQQFSNAPTAAIEGLQLFSLIVLNCAVRNGDAHLKNFGVIYDDVAGEAHLAPVYDVVTTTAYLPKDRMALTLNGTNQWPTGKELIRFAEARSLGSRKEIGLAIDRVLEATADASREMDPYIAEHAEFETIGRQMQAAWSDAREELQLRR